VERGELRHRFEMGEQRVVEGVVEHGVSPRVRRRARSSGTADDR
jgi:hypothetical protein